MARIRTIKPDFWTDNKTGTLSDRATKVFIAMLNIADDYGVISYNLEEMSIRIYPYNKKSPVVLIGKPLVDEILPKGLAIFFTWNEKPYLLIKNFDKHQKVDHPSKPIIDKFSLKEVLESLSDDNMPILANTREDSPNTRSLLKGLKGLKVGEGSGEGKTATSFLASGQTAGETTTAKDTSQQAAANASQIKDTIRNLAKGIKTDA